MFHFKPNPPKPFSNALFPLSKRRGVRGEVSIFLSCGEFTPFKRLSGRAVSFLHLIGECSGYRQSGNNARKPYIIFIEGLFLGSNEIIKFPMGTADTKHFCIPGVFVVPHSIQKCFVIKFDNVEKQEITLQKLFLRVCKIKGAKVISCFQHLVPQEFPTTH